MEKTITTKPKVLKFVPLLISSLILLSLYLYTPPQIDPLYQLFHDDRIHTLDPRQPDLNPNESHLHVGHHAMVSSDVDVCSTMGKEILLNGGNAADAAVTVALCIGSINSASSGIGGGGFITSFLAKNASAITIDAREMAPGLSFEDMFEKNPILSTIGGLSSGIPGELKGLDYLFHTHGSGNLTWQQVIQPVIELNRNGFVCQAVCASSIQSLQERYFARIPALSKNWDFIYNKDGTTKKVGDIIKRPNLAHTLDLVAKNGSLDIFYDPYGPIASHLIAINKQWGGLFTENDFSVYDVNVEPALSHKFHDTVVYTLSGVSSGLVLLSGLNLFSKLYSPTDDSWLTFHKAIETMKWMASVRTRLGGYNSEADYEELVNKYLSQEWSEYIASEKYSDNQTFDWSHYEPLYELTEPHGTSHFSILDDQDNGVSMTTTVNLLFGSIVYDPVTGVILNNEMDDFSSKSFNNSFGLEPSKRNLVQPYKRPLSSTAPTIVLKHGRPDLLIGAAGGSRITTSVFQAICRVYLANQSLLQSISYPRFHDQLIPDYVLLENSTLTEMEMGHGILDLLKLLGHKFKDTGPETSMNAIKRAGSYIHGVSDFWRKMAESDGY